MDFNIKGVPASYDKLLKKCAEIGFDMPSDIYIGTLLKSLVASKPASHVLELGTGMALSLAWMIDGLDQNSSLISVDNNPKLIEIAETFFGQDERVKLLCLDGSDWILNYTGPKFDLIFADAWPGKYSETEEILDLIKPGGFYVIDDMIIQPNWPEGHEENVQKLVKKLEKRSDFSLTKMNWSTGIILMTKKSD